MLENLFLNYANYRLIGTPNNFTKIFEFINLEFFFREYKEHIRESFKLIVKFSEYENPEIAEEYYQKDFDKFESLLPSEKLFSIWYPNHLWFNSAYVAVHGYSNGCIYTEDECHYHGSERDEVLHNNLFKEVKRLKCHECDQLFFVSILDKIIKGIEYSQIIGFKTLLDLAGSCTERWFDINKTGLKKPFKEDIKESWYFMPAGFTISPDNGGENHGRFFEFVYAIVGYSLLEFLLHNDRRKLNYCDECDNVYISKSIRKQRFCSDRCRLAWHNRKRIKSGEHAKYKRKKRMEGAKESYYG